MKRIKGPSAWYANKHLNRPGQFWDRESYDIYIRNEKMNQIGREMGRLSWQLSKNN